MAQENIDLVRRGYDAFARRDLDAALEMMDPRVEAHDPPEMPDAAVHYGRDAVRKDWQQTLDLFDDFRIDVEEIIAAGDGEILVVANYSGRGRESGATVEAKITHVWTVKDGKAIRLRQYIDRSAALEAAGLAAREDP